MLKDGLVSYWDLDEESGVRYDKHGPNNLGAFNSPLYENDALHGKVAKLLSASSQCLFISDASQVGLDLMGDMTLNIFVNLITLSGGTPNAHGLIMKWYHASMNQYQSVINTSTNILAVITDNACGGYTYTNNSFAWSPAFAIDTWYMVTIRRIGTTMTAFRNGVPIASYTCQTSANCGADFCIGMEKQRNVYKANARFAKAGAWNRGLSNEEILELYNGGDGFKYAELDVPVPVGSTADFFNFIRV